eukprot:m.155876 g.155876  ORF g.155876 m.155876 type:complete len:720 (-) comp14422_c0_seq4:106-2265(-)
MMAHFLRQPFVLGRLPTSLQLARLRSPSSIPRGWRPRAHPRLLYRVRRTTPPANTSFETLLRQRLSAILQQHPRFIRWWHQSARTAPVIVRPVIVGAIAGATSPFAWMAIVWRVAKWIFPCPPLAVLIAVPAMVSTVYLCGVYLPEMYQLLKQDPQWLLPFIISNAIGWSGSYAALTAASIAVELQANLKVRGRVLMTPVLCGVGAATIACFVLTPVSRWVFGTPECDSWFDKHLSNVDFFSLKLFTAMALAPLAVAHTYIILPVVRFSIWHQGSPWPARVVPILAASALLWKPALILVNAVDPNQLLETDGWLRDPEEYDHESIVNLGFRTVLSSVISLLSLFDGRPREGAKELLIGKTDLAMAAGLSYVENVEDEFVPVGERLSLPFIKWRLRSPSVTGTREEAVLLESASSIVDAMSVLAADSDPTPLIRTIEANVPVHRAAFQLALHAIYLEPTCQAFLERVADISKAIRSRSGLRPRQTTDDMRILYENAREVCPKFDRLLSALAKASGGEYINAELKSPVRVIEKTRLQAETAARNSYGSTCDVVRGGLEYSSTGKLAQALELLLSCDVNEHSNAKLKSALLGEEASDLKIVIVRIKDRFNQPNPSGYADCMVNFYMADDESKHICEVQLLHSQLMTVRREQGSHRYNTKTRSAEELLKATGREHLIPAADTFGPMPEPPPKFVRSTELDELAAIVHRNRPWWLWFQSSPRTS